MKFELTREQLEDLLGRAHEAGWGRGSFDTAGGFYQDSQERSDDVGEILENFELEL